MGYGGTPPHPRWPGGARIALDIVINYEERSELSFADGDGTTYQWATGPRRGMIVAMKAPAQAARKAIPATGALLLRMADQELISRGPDTIHNRLEDRGWYRALCHRLDGPRV